MMRMDEMLPIGSVVLLRDGEKRLMICGVKQMDMEQEGEEYDYLGVLYPEGFIGDEYKFLFNHEDITEVFFRGFEEEERESFVKRLSEFYA